MRLNQLKREYYPIAVVILKHKYDHLEQKQGVLSNKLEKWHSLADTYFLSIIVLLIIILTILAVDLTNISYIGEKVSSPQHDTSKIVAHIILVISIVLEAVLGYMYLLNRKRTKTLKEITHQMNDIYEQRHTIMRSKYISDENRELSDYQLYRGCTEYEYDKR